MLSTFYVYFLQICRIPFIPAHLEQEEIARKKIKVRIVLKVELYGRGMRIR